MQFLAIPIWRPSSFHKDREPEGTVALNYEERVKLWPGTEQSSETVPNYSDEFPELFNFSRPNLVPRVLTLL